MLKVVYQASLKEDDCLDETHLERMRIMESQYFKKISSPSSNRRIKMEYAQMNGPSSRGNNIKSSRSLLNKSIKGEIDSVVIKKEQSRKFLGRIPSQNEKETAHKNSMLSYFLDDTKGTHGIGSSTGAKEDRDKNYLVSNTFNNVYLPNPKHSVGKNELINSHQAIQSGITHDASNEERENMSHSLNSKPLLRLRDIFRQRAPIYESEKNASALPPVQRKQLENVSNNSSKLHPQKNPLIHDLSSILHANHSSSNLKDLKREAGSIALPSIHKDSVIEAVFIPNPDLEHAIQICESVCYSLCVLSEFFEGSLFKLNLALDGLFESTKDRGPRNLLKTFLPHFQSKETQVLSHMMDPIDLMRFVNLNHGSWHFQIVNFGYFDVIQKRRSLHEHR